MASNIFTVKNLSFSYGKQQVLNGLDFSLHEGRITTLIGANGCGKSTLFNLMTKNLKPDQGEVFLREENIANLRLKDFAREAAIHPNTGRAFVYPNKPGGKPKTQNQKAPES